MTLLSLLGFAISPCLILLTALSLRSYFGAARRSDLPYVQTETGQFFFALVLLALFHLGLLTLAYLSFVAAKDLWILHSRGRVLTLISMFFLLLLSSILFYAMFTDPRATFWERFLPGGSAILCLVSITYLVLPSVATRFQSSPIRNS